MDKEQFIETVLMSPEVRSLKAPEDEPSKRNLCELYTDAVVRAVALSHDWDFAMDVADEDLTVGQSVYILKGNDNNCRRIKSVRFGASGADDTDLTPVVRKNHVDLDHYLEYHTPSECGVWVRRRNYQNSPRIQLLDTPTTAGNIIRYRFWVKNIQFDDLPDGDMDIALLFGVRYLFNPILKDAYESELKKAVENIQPFSGEPMETMADPHVVLENIYRSGEVGY